MNKKEINELFKNKVDKFLPALKKNNNPDADRAIFLSMGAGGSFVKVLTFSERELFEEPINVLIAQKNISGVYSEEFIEKKVVEFYHNVLINEQKKTQLIQELVDLIMDAPINKYFVASGIDNIIIHSTDAYPILDSTLKIIKQEDFPFGENEYRCANVELLGNPSIYTEVKAGDSEKAKEIALHNFMISFNLLKLYVPHSRPVLRGCLLSGRQEILLFNKDKERISSNFSRVGDLPSRNYLNRNLYKQLEESGVGYLREDNSIGKVVKECLYWFGLGLEEKYPSAKLLNFVTALESLLKRKNENSELRRTVSERGALFLCDEFEQRKEAVKELKRIYDIRSKVVHTGALVEDNNLALLAGAYARAILIKLIKESRRFDGDFEAFLTCLDELKLGKDYNIVVTT